jgi:hypothetical protein
MATTKTAKTRTQPAISLTQVEPEQTNKADQGKPTKPRHFRKKAQEEIGKKYGGIVEKLAEKATEGSVQHTKLLFELGGVREQVQVSSSKRRRSPSLGKLLLKEAEALKRSKEKATENS